MPSNISKHLHFRARLELLHLELEIYIDILNEYRAACIGREARDDAEKGEGMKEVGQRFESAVPRCSGSAGRGSFLEIKQLMRTRQMQNGYISNSKSFPKYDEGGVSVRMEVRLRVRWG